MFALGWSRQTAEVIQRHLHPLERVKGCPPAAQDVVRVELTHLALDSSELQAPDESHMGDPIQNEILAFIRLSEPDRLPGPF